MRRDIAWLLAILLASGLALAIEGPGFVINRSGASGIIVYGEQDIQTPRYRYWNLTGDDFGPELTDTGSVGADILWVVAKASHERQEALIAIEDFVNDVNLMLLNSTGDMQVLVELTADTENTGAQEVDLAYEDVSGDALIVYENTLNPDAFLGYRTWNGTLSSEKNSSLAVSQEIRIVKTVARPGTDLIMVLTLDDTNTIQGILWNGTEFDNTPRTSLSVDAQEDNEINFDFVWEGRTEEGLAVYADPQNGGEWAYRTYNTTSKTWSAQQTFFTLNGGNAQKTKLCSHPNSSLVGFVSKDSSKDINVRIWNGTSGSVDTGFPTEEASVEDNPNGAGGFDCAFETNGTQIIFGYVDVTNSVDDRIHHFYYDMDTALWSVTAIDDANTTDPLGAGGGVIEALDFVSHPLTEEIMAVAMLDGNDIDVALWNGTNFTTITTSQPELSAECTAGTQVCGAFDWFRNDPVPDITQIAPADGSSGNLGAAVTIQANVTDNLQVDVVLLNVSLPNGSTRQYTLLQTDGLFQITFNDTNAQGQHDFVFIANDTSRHQNVNITNVSYTIGDTEEPNVTLVVGNGTFEVGTLVNITANVTDDTAVDKVLVNLTFPNGSTLLLTPENLTGEHHVNVTMTIDMPFGVHNFTIIANDTNNNVNNSITNSFNYTDISVPAVSALTVEPDPANQSDTLNITATVVENGKVSTAQANVTFPNGSSLLLAMTNDSTTFNVSYATELFHEQGTYNIRIVVNDTNNINQSIYTEVTVNDVTAPTFTILLPANSTTFLLNNNLSVRVNASDNRNVSVVRVNVTQPPLQEVLV
ncbi:MAG: hypothetical protein QGF25_05935 [Candidatus Woesearchaeota archaeon]|jgi:hypothetical protein|nr:hypothetical protein [Candidatus Woesearchaeota archaeon]MDP7646837.1 hypothetical protein [Candidatus Woesearchaeota archaeon]